MLVTKLQNRKASGNVSATSARTEKMLSLQLGARVPTPVPSLLLIQNLSVTNQQQDVANKVKAQEEPATRKVKLALSQRFLQKRNHPSPDSLQTDVRGVARLMKPKSLLNLS